MNRKMQRKIEAADATADKAKAIRLENDAALAEIEATDWPDWLRAYTPAGLAVSQPHIKGPEPRRVLRGLKAAIVAGPVDPAILATLTAKLDAAREAVKAAQNAIAPPDQFGRTMEALNEMWAWPGGVGPKTAEKMRVLKTAEAAWGYAIGEHSHYKQQVHHAFWDAYAPRQY